MAYASALSALSAPPAEIGRGTSRNGAPDSAKAVVLAPSAVTALERMNAALRRTAHAALAMLACADGPRGLPASESSPKWREYLLEINGFEIRYFDECNATVVFGIGAAQAFGRPPHAGAARNPHNILMWSSAFGAPDRFLAQVLTASTSLWLDPDAIFPAPWLERWGAEPHHEVARRTLWTDDFAEFLAAVERSASFRWVGGAAAAAPVTAPAAALSGVVDGALAASIEVDARARGKILRALAGEHQATLLSGDALVERDGTILLRAQSVTLDRSTSRAVCGTWSMIANPRLPLQSPREHRVNFAVLGRVS